jgi:hypothetical protein
MDWFDRRILEFAVRWARYGGVPEDEIFPKFGIHPSDFCLRVGQTIDTTPTETALLTAQARLLLVGARANSRLGRPLVSFLDSAPNASATLGGAVDRRTLPRGF